MSGSLSRRLERLEQHMPGPDRPWRADDYARWRQQHIDAGDPEGVVAQAHAAVPVSYTHLTLPTKRIV